MNLQGKTAIVTGAGRGIGRAITLRLVHQGMNVVAVARTARDLEETASQAARLPGVCMAQSADVTRSDQVNALVKGAISGFGGLDVLVNNAGTAPRCSLTKIDDKLLAETLGINIQAVVYTCRAAWPALQESRGTIINISSMAAKDPFPGFSLYGATKAWVNTFTQALAEEGKPLGIRAFSVGPGAVETQMLRGAFPNFPADQALHPDDIAAAVEWLLDERAGHVTGQTIYVKK